jgi:BirA family biotin operon repressor/biotin-[acetyl-CoA-carboxylase] ligase
MSFGAPHRHYARVDSTNSRARELAAAGAPHGTVVTAAEQTAGRGRQGRTWTAPPGKALLYSAVLRPLENRHLLLPLAVPLAVCAAAEQLARHQHGDPTEDSPAAVKRAAGGSRADGAWQCGVKWPNDVQVEGRKLAGVLVEARPQDGWAVIGVGLNLTISPEEFPPDLRDKAVSIFDSSAGSRGGSRRSNNGEAPSRPPTTPLTATAALSAQLDRWVQAEPETVLAAWRERDALRGREVAWDGGSGVADGVDDRGYLLVLTPGGERVAVGAGEVHLRL